MVAWQNSMNGSQMQELASFILSLQGTNPPGGKDPQGDKVVSTSPSTNDTTATTVTIVNK
jgi:cytochrome c oxidase cbb3-type subunit 3